MARILDLTPDLQTKLAQLFATGVTIGDACAHVGISESTYYKWMKKGRLAHKGSEIYVQFFQTIMRARVQARIGAVAIITRSIQSGNTEDARWFLERNDPENWARRTYGKIEGLDKLLELASKLNISASDLFNSMIAELVSVDAADRETSD